MAFTMLNCPFMSRVCRFVAILALLVTAGAAAPGAWAGPAAQDQGLAVITSPLEGSNAGGVVPILGTATHPEFVRYEVAFAYSPNPTDTWFAITPAGSAPVINEVLARWDTSQISDGLYTVRLRVFYGQGAFLEALVGSVRVQNGTPTPGLGNLPGPTPTEAPPATPTQPVIVLPPTSTPRATTVVVPPDDDPGPAAPPDRGGSSAPPISTGLVGTAFASGVRLTLIGFLLLAAYVSLRAALRARPRR